MTAQDDTRTKLLKQRWVASCSQYQQYREVADKVEKDPLVSNWYQQRSDANHDSSRGSDPGEHFKSYQEVFAGMFTIESILTEQQPLQVLDMCMAPGGFARAILSKNEEAFVTGTTLSPSEGGHLMHVQGRRSLQEFQAHFHCEQRDIIRSPKSPYPPFLSRGSQQDTDTKYDVVAADGAPFNQEVGPYRRHLSGFLISSELIIALHHIHPSETLIILLHRLEKPEDGTDRAKPANHAPNSASTSPRRHTPTALPSTSSLTTSSQSTPEAKALLARCDEEWREKNHHHVADDGAEFF